MISTPEALVLQARRQFDALLALVEAARDERIDRVEGQLFGGLLSLGLTLLRQFVAQHGTGDAGPLLDTAAATSGSLPIAAPEGHALFPAKAATARRRRARRGPTARPRAADGHRQPLTGRRSV